MAHKSRIGMPSKVGYRKQPEDVLAYAFAQPHSSIREISEHCGLAKSSIWSILNELGAHPYWPTSMRAIMAGDAQKRYPGQKFMLVPAKK